MKTNCLILLFIQLLLLANVSVYSENSYRFRTFSPKGGFYYDGVQDIIQDNDGFIWILLENDLLRFDGYEYKRYLPYFQNQDVWDVWNFFNIAKDTSGQLYVSTSNGLFGYSKLSDSFEKMIDESVSDLTIDLKNNIWCKFKGRLYRVNKINKNLEPILYDQKPVNNVGYLSCGENDLFFTSASNKIYHYNDENSGEITLFHFFPPDYSIQGIRRAGEYLWILTAKHGIFKINISTKETEERLRFQDEEENIPVKTFYVDKNNQLWIGTQRGLYILNPSTGERQLYLHSRFDKFSLPNNSVWTITGDSHRNIWIGTYAGGLCYVDLDENVYFKTYTPFESPLNHNLVSSFVEDGNRLWLGTEGGGLNCLDKSTDVFTHYKHDNGKNSLSYNNIKSLALDSRKRLWIAMYRGGLDCLDTGTDKFRHFLNNPNDKESLYGNSLRKIILDGDSGLWIAYQVNRSLVSYFSFQSEKFTHYFFDEDAYVFDIQRDNYGNLLAVTHKRLYKIDVKKRIVENMFSEKTGILNARSLCVDAENNIWIGTIGRGLVKYDISTSELMHVDDILQFNISAICSICTDASGCLWLGTNNGLFRYNIRNHSYQKFDESDGFQGQVYYPLAALRSETGKLYFGGTNGFTVVEPQNIKPNKRKPKVTISDFYIDNIPATSRFWKDSLYNEILLNHNQTNFGFKFSSDNYLSSNKNRFKYRLRGYDDRWVMADASNRTVMYSKIPAGTYYFEILTANNDGVWSDAPAIIKIKCKPAPWASLPAYLLYSVLVLGIAGIIFYYYAEKRKLKIQLHIDRLDKQKKEEIHQSQLRFFTNISHDFRTPLSLILAAIDNLKQEGLKEYYYRILHNNARRLLDLVNDLMDFRTVENGKMQLQVQLLNVNRLITDLSSDFKDYAKKREIKFEIICDPELPDALYADKQILEKVVMNLLNNAFKYTKDKGGIMIETYSGLSKFVSKYSYNYHVPGDRIPENGFLLVVRDTGIGISKDSIESVFERFYKVNTANLSQHLGTGIGLALVKSLVLLHKGSISIFSEPDKGTDIAIHLPAGSGVYDESEFAEIDKNTVQSPDSGSLPENNTDITDGMEKMLLPNKKRILIVEDNPDLRSLLSGFLSQSYEILEAANGVEVSGILAKTDLNLIISDIMMPLKDGVTLCRELKADVNTSHIPVILLTAKTGLESKIEGTDAGADIYFEKPVDLNLLLLTIRNMFKRQQNQREFYAKNYYVDSAELSGNERDNDFLKNLVKIIDKSLDQPNIDVNYIASGLSMSRSKLYSKVKMLTDKSIVEFILNYKLRKAARLIIEQDMSMAQVIEKIGIKSQSYFINVFKKEFGETPFAFSLKHKKPACKSYAKEHNHDAGSL
ncbi:hybrid sensor histidine kinase/response regulator [Bacteroidia bacterium]|nr:hybrid sensor histidine kinase/response regulator [Bacteroidia bacterium]